jgi:4-diphosphocytidyl-2-C-methyl-D-erythritol kinase
VTAPATEFAPAKVNLALHVTGRRSDGYHLLDSLVCFPAIGDVLSAKPAAERTLEIEGPFSAELEGTASNMVLRAAELLGSGGARLCLKKNLPVASGIGGGSADAAAALRLLSRLHSAPLPDVAALTRLGADVPVCLLSRPARMRGIGDEVEPLVLPRFWLVLVNPRRPLETGAVFAKLHRRDNAGLPDLPAFPKPAALFEWLRQATRNDLEAAARSVEPTVTEVLAALERIPGCRLARMSGSGATCFGLFESASEAGEAAEGLRRVRPEWWVEAGESRPGGT